MKEIFGSDAFSPEIIAEKVENIGVKKARLPIISMAMLGLLAGAFIGLGGMFYATITSDISLGFGISRLLGGIVFSLGLIMVVIAGAELFTGNNLLVMAWANGSISFREVLRNWVVVCMANFIGAFGIAVIVFLSGQPEMNGGGVANNYIKIAAAKCDLDMVHAFFSGVLCNILVCLAVWMAQAGRSVADKVLVILFPVAAFVAAGLEHSIANMFFIPMGILLHSQQVASDAFGSISWGGFFHNILPVIAGNIIGGSFFVAFFYYIIYRWKKPVGY